MTRRSRNGKGQTDRDAPVAQAGVRRSVRKGRSVQPQGDCRTASRPLRQNRKNGCQRKGNRENRRSKGAQRCAPSGRDGLTTGARVVVQAAQQRAAQTRQPDEKRGVWREEHPSNRAELMRDVPIVPVCGGVHEGGGFPSCCAAHEKVLDLLIARLA